MTWASDAALPAPICSRRRVGSARAARRRLPGRRLTWAGPSSSTRTSACACRARSITSSSIPYGLRFDEVTASSLVKIDLEGNPVGPQGHRANKAGFVIHSALHMARPDAPASGTCTRSPAWRWPAQDEGLLPVHMYSHNFWSASATTTSKARACALDERSRLVQSFGMKNQALILRNHGLLTVGETIPEAFIRFWRLNRSCEIQLAAQSAQLRLPSTEVCEASFQMGEEFLTDQAPLGKLEFDALVRKIESEGRFLQELMAMTPQNRSAQRLRHQVRQRQRLGLGLGERAVREKLPAHGHPGRRRATSSRRTSRACRPGTRCASPSRATSAAAAAST